MNTVGQWLAQARLRLANANSKSADPESAALDAELIAKHITGRSRASLFAFPEAPLLEEQLAAMNSLLERRYSGEPLAYITGEREFWSLPLALASGALIPRPDTEILVEHALARLPTLPPGNILELGTGSGAIALALAQEVSDRLIVAVERHAPALHIAQHNIRQWGQQRVQLLQGDWIDSFADNSAAMIISNPPYLASNDEHLPSLSYEPQTALVSGKTGLEDIEQIIIDTQRVGQAGCLLILEHGYEQGSAVRSLLQHYNFIRVNTEQDLAGHERVTLGYLREG